jgi:hypothetical protein
MLGVITPAAQQHCLHLAVALGLFGLREAIARTMADSFTHEITQ